MKKPKLPQIRKPLLLQSRKLSRETGLQPRDQIRKRRQGRKRPLRQGGY